MLRVAYYLDEGRPSRKEIQSTLGFETLDKAAALGLETASTLTDPLSVHK